MSTAPLPLRELEDLEFVEFVETGLLLWIATSGNVCDGPRGGCLARNEVAVKMAEWLTRGLPRTGRTWCKGHCDCHLVPLIDFGFGVPSALDTGNTPFDTSEVEPLGREPGQPFSEMGDGYDLEVFVDELRGLPVVGTLRQQVESIIRALDEGTINFDEAKALADFHLFEVIEHLESQAERSETLRQVAQEAAERRLERARRESASLPTGWSEARQGGYVFSSRDRRFDGAWFGQRGRRTVLIVDGVEYEMPRRATIQDADRRLQELRRG